MTPRASGGISGFVPRGEAGRISLRSCGLSTFAVVRRTFVDIARPVLRQQPAPHVEVKGRMRPVSNTCHEAVFHRIVMDVIDVPGEISLVTDGVLPVPPLPRRKLATRITPDGIPSSEQVSAEVSFDPPPAPGEIRVSLRQGQDCMKVIGQDDDSIDDEGALLPGRAKRSAKRTDMINKSCRLAFGERYREEIGAALHPVASVSDHSGIISRISLRSSGLL
jgi:hypothetical protein